jgi:3-hydroxyisobutyrate dehydrogenase-like beta-hydroxyacid dehydrogenase
MKIGFIGLGAMGGFMAWSLQQAGHELRVHDVRREAAAALLAGGATWADSPAQAANGVELLFTCLPGPPEVEAVALGEGGLLGAMQAGSTWFDLTTNSPEVVRRLGATFLAHGVDVLDAPVSGGPKGAQSRKLALWVGGNEAVFKKYLAVLKAMGDEPMYIGPIGAGCLAKLVHNCANFSVQNALAEVFTLGVKAGLDPLTLFKALRQGTTGRSRTFDRLAEQFLPGIYDPPAFTLRLAHKDMSLATALARSCDVPMRMADVAMQDMTEAMQRGWSERDARISLTLQEERAGVSVRVPPDQLRDQMREPRPPEPQKDRT